MSGSSYCVPWHFDPLLRMHSGYSPLSACYKAVALAYWREGWRFQMTSLLSLQLRLWPFRSRKLADAEQVMWLTLLLPQSGSQHGCSPKWLQEQFLWRSKGFHRSFVMFSDKLVRQFQQCNDINTYIRIFQVVLLFLEHYWCYNIAEKANMCSDRKLVMPQIFDSNIIYSCCLFLS